MKRRIHTACAPALAVLVLVGVAEANPPEPSPGQAALAAAAQQQKHLFILFCKQDDGASQAMRQALAAAVGKRAGQASTAEVLTTDPAERPLVERYGLGRSPMPLVLAVAPNGAVTGAFPLKLTEQDVAGAFVGPALAACLKAMQAHKLVLLCVPGADGVGVPAGVHEFTADTQYRAVTEVVTVRADEAEAALLGKLRIKRGAPTTTYFIAPPGSLLGTFEGTLTKQQLIDKLKAAQNSCCPGGKCGPGGCCPGGCCSGGKCDPKP